MAAATVESDLYSRSSYPLRDPAGTTTVAIEHTFATTELDDAGDVVKLVKLPDSVELLELWEQHADLDSGGTALDMDIVLVDDDNAAGSEKVLYNAGTAFATATTAWLGCDPTAYFGYKVVSRGNTAAYLAVKVNTAATTAAAVKARFILRYRGAGAGGVA